MNNPQQSLGVIYARADYAGFFKRVMVAGVDLAVIILVAAGWLYISDDYFVYQDTYFTFSYFFLAIYVVRRDAVPIGRDRLQEVMLGFMGWHLTYREVKTRRIE